MAAVNTLEYVSIGVINDFVCILTGYVQVHVRPNHNQTTPGPITYCCIARPQFRLRRPVRDAGRHPRCQRRPHHHARVPANHGFDGEHRHHRVHHEVRQEQAGAVPRAGFALLEGGRGARDLARSHARVRAREERARKSRCGAKPLCRSGANSYSTLAGTRAPGSRTAKITT